MRELTVKVHEIAVDGLPDMEALTGRVAFIFDGCLVSGWPLTGDDYSEDVIEATKQHGLLWEANSDVGHGRPFANVTHWVEWPEPVWDTEREG